MSQESLKLTTYFGERHRSGRALVADALLDLYGRSEVRVSVLLRGVEGFGARHGLRSDRLLTLSEDLPVVSVAVDTRARVLALLEEVLAIKRHGLVTLERARMPAGDLAIEALPETTKLTVYVGRHERVAGRPAYMAVCELLQRHGVAGATVLLGVDGTAHGARQRARFFAGNANVPMMIIAVGAGAAIAGLLPDLGAALAHPLVTVERVRLCKRDGVRIEDPWQTAGVDDSGLPIWHKLMIYTSEQAKHDGLPLHVAVVQALRASGARGATCLRGVWGFRGHAPPHGDRMFQLRRRVPVVTVVVDEPERMAASWRIVDEITRRDGLVTSELVPAAVEVKDGSAQGSLRLARPD